MQKVVTFSHKSMRGEADAMWQKVSQRHELDDDEEDWQTLSLEAGLNFLIAESPHFASLMECVVARSGAQHAPSYESAIRANIYKGKHIYSHEQ